MVGNIKHTNYLSGITGVCKTVFSKTVSSRPLFENKFVKKSKDSTCSKVVVLNTQIRLFVPQSGLPWVVSAFFILVSCDVADMI